MAVKTWVIILPADFRKRIPKTAIHSWGCGNSGAGFIRFRAIMLRRVEVAQSCPTFWNSSGQNTGVGSLSLLQGIFPTQGSNPGLPHCGRILYPLNHQGSPRILEWVAYPFSRGSSQPRNRNQGLLHCRRILYQLSYEGSPVPGKLVKKRPREAAVKMQRHYFANKGPSSQGYGFPCSHVWI